MSGFGRFPPLSEDALAAFRLGGLTAAAAVVRVPDGEYECPGCGGSGVGDKATGRVNSVGGRQCATCHAYGYLVKRAGTPLRRAW